MSGCGEKIYGVFHFILFLTSTMPVEKLLPDSIIAPRWYATLFVACLWGIIILLCKKCSFECYYKSLAIPSICVIQVVFFVLQGFDFLSTMDGATACFSNVAGLSSCLCFSLPVLCYQVKRGNKTVRRISLCVLICSILLVVSLQSRAGMICLSMLGCYFVRKKKLLLYIYCSSMLLLLPPLFWLLKPTSTMGRWFVIQRTVDMILQYPLTGWGMNGFQANYMNFQADFLSTHPHSDYMQLADDMTHPLNEYLLIAVDFGLMGLLLVVFFIFYVFSYFKRHTSEEGFIGITAITFIVVFSVFSFPLSYPFSWIVLLFSLCLVFRGKSDCKFKGVLPKLMMHVFVVVACALIGVYYYGVKWELLNDRVNDGYRYGIRQNFETLYPVLHFNSRFLYNYAFVLYNLNLYKESLKVAMECQRKHSGYSLSLLIGDIYWAMGNDETAIKCYLSAHYMCPCRFAPLCAIYDVYKKQSNFEKCKMMSKIILEKPIKIHSAETLEYINYIKQDTKYPYFNFPNRKK